MIPKAQAADAHSNGETGSVSSRLGSTTESLSSPASLAEVLRSTRRMIIEQDGECILQLARQLENQADVTDAQLRATAQSRALATGVLSYNLGAFLLELGRTTMTLRMGQIPSEAVVNGGPAVFISPAGSSISAEASSTFMDAGLVKSFTRTLQVLYLDYADSSKVATGIVKALELVTKEHVHSADSSAGKSDNSTKHSDPSQDGRTNNIDHVSQSTETSSQVNHNSLQVDHVESYNAIQSYGESKAVTDDMEHDQDLDGGFTAANGDEYMHGNAEEAGGHEDSESDGDEDSDSLEFLKQSILEGL